MGKYRGNLEEAHDVAGSAGVRPPSDAKALKGGEVSTRDDKVRTKADRTRTPHKGGKGKIGSLPGKEFRPAYGAAAKGKKGKKGFGRFTARDGAMALSGRY